MSDIGPMIRTVDLRVDYEDVHAVRDLNFTVARGEIVGLIGPNGAGKTSTLRVLAGLQEPTYGDAFINGIDIAEHPADLRRVIGYMPDFPPVYDELRVWEFLDLFAAAYQLDPSKQRARVDECLDITGIDDKRDAKCKGLSRGMKQRLVLAKSMLHDPELLILDEPASGLDPGARIELRRSLKALREAGKTILISSHILTELADFCTSIAIMNQGRMVIQGPIDEVIQQMAPHRSIVIEVIGEPGDALDPVLAGHEAVAGVTRDDGEVVIEFTGSDDDAADLLARLVTERIRVKAFYERRMDVEDVFMQISQEAESS